MSVSYRNISFAAAGSMAALMEQGSEVVVRGASTKELLNRVTVLERPLEKFLFLPGRLNDVFAQVAESLWVMAGRNDLEWLERYLPRAKDFSDDNGKTWRAGYGPRLRRWHREVDQVYEVKRLLSEDASTRRAVMSLFDPESDFKESKDIPCNNWLSWIIRNGHLYLNVAVRSNDAMWGFSGANAFEWSMLHEMMAFWTGTRVGTATYFATSFHLYERHYARASKIAMGFHGLSPYDFDVERARFATPWDRLDASLENWFAIEERVREDPDAPLPGGAGTLDPFLMTSLQIVRLKWGSEQWTDTKLKAEFSSLPPSDMLVAAYEYFGRQKETVLQDIPHPRIAAFFDACRHPAATYRPRFASAVKKLHARKDRAYGDAWKKRGELISILPNIARKVDRLEVFVNSAQELVDESVLDTAVDLYVYVTKYRLFLGDDAADSRTPRDGSVKPGDADHRASFDRLVDEADFHNCEDGLRENIGKVVESFARLWPRVEPLASLHERQRLAEQLAEAVCGLVAAILEKQPQLAAHFLRSELTCRAGSEEGIRN